MEAPFKLLSVPSVVSCGTLLCLDLESVITEVFVRESLLYKVVLQSGGFIPLNLPVNPVLG